jgi:Putative Ig domain
VKQADLGPASFSREIMSPIALADARTTIRGFRFCLAVVAVLLVSAFAVAQLRYSREDFDRPTRISQWVHPLAVVANFGPATQGQVFTSTLQVPGGLAPFRFWVAQGALPAGLSLNPSTGVISGVPAASGSFAFIVEATDSRFGVGRRLLQFNVAPGNARPISITLSPQSVQIAPGATLQFTATVQNTSQTAVVWSASAGSISPNGVFTAPITPGTAVVTAAAAGSNGVRSSANITVMSVQSTPLSIGTSFLGNAQVNTAYDARLTAQGGIAPYSWSLISGSLPNGLTLNPSSGVIAGSVSRAGAFTFTTEVTDASSKTATRQLTLTATASNSGNFDGPAELPRSTVQSTMADTPAPGNTINVPAGANLQTVLNNANCGDTIQLQAGATFTGSFTLPAKSCDDNNWIVIRTSAPDASLPAEGSRMNPCYAGVKSLPGRPAFTCPVTTASVLARIVAPNMQPALMLAAGANHYRLGPGLEVTRAPGSGLNYALVGPSGQIDHLIVDRDWIHGTAQDETTRGIFLSGITFAAIVDSYLNDFHCITNGACSDAQAISGGTGPLPQGNWKISGNFLESSTENILFGGVLKNSVTPADITITGNHFYKPLIWMPGQPGFVGGKETASATCPHWDPTGTIGQCPFVVKNLFELKNAQRVLFEGNILEYNWPGFSQNGESILLSGLNPAALPGSPVYSRLSIESITVRYNRIAHTTGGFSIVNMAGQGEGTAPAQPNLPVSNVSVHDNVFDDMSKAYVNNGDGSSFNLFNIGSCAVCAPLTGISIRHNNVFSASPRFFILGSPQPQQLDLTFADNIVSTPAGLAVVANGTTCATSGASNLSRISACLVPNYKFAGNALIGATNTWPTGNYSPEDTATLQFADYNGGSGGDYHLLPSSPYKGAATDGKDLGANIDTVNQAIARVD